MQFRALAVADDVLVAAGGEASTEGLEALARMRRAGRRIVLVTWRELERCMSALPTLDAFDAIVAEGGAVLYLASPPTEHPLAPSLPRSLHAQLVTWGLREPTYGRIAITARLADARSVPAVTARLRRAGFDAGFDVARGELTVIPAGVNVATGARVAFEHLGCAPSYSIGVARGAHASFLFAACGYRVAVADATPLLRASADHVTRAPCAAGIVEFCTSIGTPAARAHASSRDRDAAPPISTCRSRRRGPA